MLLLRLFLLLLLTGCSSSVVHQYEEQRLQALSNPSVEESWTPNGRVALSQVMIEALVREASKPKLAKIDSLSIDKPGFSATPRVSVKAVEFREGSCATCAVVSLDLEGTLNWKLLTKSGEQPLGAKAEVEVDVAITNDSESWTVRLRPKKVRDLRLETLGWSAALKTALSSPMEAWLREAALAMIQRTPCWNYRRAICRSSAQGRTA